MIKALMRFVDYDKLDTLQILEDDTPTPCPPSPILSASPGLFFARFSAKIEVDEEDEDDDMLFSPRSASTPLKPSTATSSPSSQKLGQLRCKDDKTSDSKPLSTHSAKRPLKRKGLSVVDTNAPASRAPANKRFRFEEHAVDYKQIERRQRDEREERAERRTRDARSREHECREEKRREDARRKVESLKRRVDVVLREESPCEEKQLEARLDVVVREQKEADQRVAALDSLPSRSAESHRDETLLRKRALGTCKRVLLRRIAELKFSKSRQ